MHHSSKYTVYFINAPGGSTRKPYRVMPRARVKPPWSVWIGMARACRQEGLEEVFRGGLAEAFAEYMLSLWDRGLREARLVYELLSRHGVGPGSSVLELGAGVGRVAVPLARMGYRVTGVEYSPLFVRIGRERVLREGVGVELLEGDAWSLDDVLGDRVFDAAYMVWSTLLGYAGEECDLELLSGVARHVRRGGLLVIANTVSYDMEGLLASCMCRGPFITFYGGYAVVEEPRFDPVSQVLESRWVFYRVEGRDLRFIGETRFRLRVYTLKELVELAGRAGWRLEAAYSDPEKGAGYLPCRSGFNVVFSRAL